MTGFYHSINITIQCDSIEIRVACCEHFICLSNLNIISFNMDRLIEDNLQVSDILF